MTISTLASIVAVALSGIIPAGCNSAKSTAKKPANKPVLAMAAPAAAAQTTSDKKTATAASSAPAIVFTGTNCFLGDVNLTNHAETWVRISPTKQCMFTTKMVDRKNAQITVALESRRTNSKVPDLAVTQITTRADQPLEIAFGGCSLAFTPHIAE